MENSIISFATCNTILDGISCSLFHVHAHKKTTTNEQEQWTDKMCLSTALYSSVYLFLYSLLPASLGHIFVFSFVVTMSDLTSIFTFYFVTLALLLPPRTKNITMMYHDVDKKSRFIIFTIVSIIISLLFTKYPISAHHIINVMLTPSQTLTTWCRLFSADFIFVRYPMYVHCLLALLHLFITNGKNYFHLCIALHEMV